MAGRPLPKGMTVSYLAKARTSLPAVAELPEIPRFGETGFELPVPFTVYDTGDEPVVSGTVTTWVTPRRGG